MPDEKTYSNDEIATHLEKNLPNWYFENGWIRRKYKTSGWKGTLMVINTIGHLAEAAWHHPDISASYAFVIVKLQNHAAKGITDKDFLLAKKSKMLFSGIQLKRTILWKEHQKIQGSNTLNTINKLFYSFCDFRAR